MSIGVNERDGGTLYNTQLLFDADGTLIQRRRSHPTYHERMVWGQGEAPACAPSTARSAAFVSSRAGSTTTPGALRDDRDREQIHSAMYPGSIFGNLFAEQTGINSGSTHWSLRASCLRTAWLDPDQQAQIVKDTGGSMVRSPEVALPRSRHPMAP